MAKEVDELEALEDDENALSFIARRLLRSLSEDIKLLNKDIEAIPCQITLFGQCTERYEDPNDPQGLLFDGSVAQDDDSPGEPASVDKNDDNAGNIAAHTRRKKTDKSFVDQLPRKEVVIPVQEHAKTCSWVVKSR